MMDQIEEDFDQHILSALDSLDRHQYKCMFHILVGKLMQYDLDRYEDPKAQTASENTVYFVSTSPYCGYVKVSNSPDMITATNASTRCVIIHTRKVAADIKFDEYMARTFAARASGNGWFRFDAAELPALFAGTLTK